VRGRLTNTNPGPKGISDKIFNNNNFVGKKRGRDKTRQRGDSASVGGRVFSDAPFRKNHDRVRREKAEREMRMTAWGRR